MSRPSQPLWRNRIAGSGTLKVAEAKPHALNFRTHTSGQSQALAASLDNVGWVQQVVVNTTTGNLLDGHLRVELAKARGEVELPCLFVELSEDEERLVLASLDPIAAMASADRERLAELLSSITSEDEQVRGLLELIARQERVVLDLPAGPVDPDAVPEVPTEPVSQPGDLWLLGEHRLLCGDATSVEDVCRLMAGERAVAMITDPPYLVDYDGGNHPDTKQTTAEEKTKHWDHHREHEGSVAFYRDSLKAATAGALVERPVVYQWFAVMRCEVVWQAWREAGLLLHQVIIWHKNRPVLGRNDFLWDWEPCAYGWVQGRRPQTARRPPAATRCVWQVDQREGVEADLGSVHPTIKPVELIRRPILWHTSPGELLYEPFSGSGTCLIAAEQLGRRCCALELAPAFVDVAVVRWQRFAGKEAILDASGQSFAEVAAERATGSASQGSGA